MRFLYKKIYITQERRHAISGFEFIFFSACEVSHLLTVYTEIKIWFFCGKECTFCILRTTSINIYFLYLLIIKNDLILILNT